MLSRNTLVKLWGKVCEHCWCLNQPVKLGTSKSSSNHWGARLAQPQVLLGVKLAFVIRFVQRSPNWQPSKNLFFLQPTASTQKKTIVEGKAHKEEEEEEGEEEDDEVTMCQKEGMLEMVINVPCAMEWTLHRKLKMKGTFSDVITISLLWIRWLLIDPWLLDTVCKLLSKAKNHKVLEVTNCKESTIMTIVGVLTGRPDGCVSFAGDVLGNCSLSRRWLTKSLLKHTPHD